MNQFFRISTLLNLSCFQSFYLFEAEKNTGLQKVKLCILFFLRWLSMNFSARRTWRAYFCTSKPERKGNKAFSDWSNYCWGYNVNLSQFSPSFVFQFSSFATAWSGFQISMSYTSLGAQICTFIGHIGSVRFKKY